MYHYYLVIILNGTIPGQVLLDMSSMVECQKEKAIYEEAIDTPMVCLKMFKPEIEL